MKEISVRSLRAGLIFTEPVFIEENDLLVPKGIAIRKKDLERLNSWGIVTVTTEGEVIPEAAEEGTIWFPTVPPHPPVFPAPAPAPAPSPAGVQEKRGGRRSYQDFILDLTEFFDCLASGTTPDVSSIDRSTRGIIRIVQEYPARFLNYILGEGGGHDFAKSAINAGIFSYLIAAELRLPTFRIFQIVAAALLHDAGMLRLPRGLKEKKDALTSEEIKLIKSHPLHSYRIVHEELFYPDEVGRIVLQHHERWDGNGYPQRIAGDAIDMGARILSVADAFEAMISEKTYRNSMIASHAMRNILAGHSKHFDVEVVKAFIKIMGIYPRGSLVLLNNGAVARVAEVRKNAPLQPRIILLTDGFGKVYDENEGMVIDLLEESALFILRTLEGRESSKGHA
ncbi:MAG: HD domain-containing protein [Spirochaetaceae bacterium]|jgi:hypothetical protein|nr:HD domain-containing protein [Spirochaetaceae bacterium]